VAIYKSFIAAPTLGAPFDAHDGIDHLVEDMRWLIKEAVTRALAADALLRPAMAALVAGHHSVMSTAETHEVAGGLVPAQVLRYPMVNMG
jgi:hypothetical protein